MPVADVAETLNEASRLADEQAKLQAEALAIGLTVPSVWNNFWTRKIDDINRRIDEQFADVAGRDVGPGSGINSAEPGDSAAVGN